MFYALSRFVVMALFRTLWRPVIEGRENIPPTGPLIVASNHLSFIDSIVIPVTVPRKVVFLAKAEYWEGRSPATWPRRLFFAAFEAVPVQREQQQDAQASLDLARGVVERGDAFGIYPEGTRSPDGRLHRGRTGVARLAVATGASVVPCAVIGTNHVQPPGSNTFRPAKVIVRFGPPIDTEGLARRYHKGALLRAITDEVMDAIAAMSGQERSGRYASDVKAELSSM